MAGGSASDVRSPYPADEFLIQFGPHNITGDKDTDFTIDNYTVPFAFKPVRAEWTARFAKVTSGAMTVNLEDDTGTAKSIITDQNITAVTSGAASATALTVKTTETIFAGAKLKLSFIAKDVSNVADGLVIRLWGRPVN